MERVASEEFISIVRLKLGPFETNSYILTCPRTGEGVLVDAPADVPEILNASKGTVLKHILITHNHFDHTGALSELKSRLGIPVSAHRLDAQSLPSKAEILLEDGQEVTFGDVRLKVLHTPGHTPGSLCFLTGKHLIAGDTIFPGGPGSTRSPAQLKQIIESVTSKIFALPDDTAVYPGHGDFTVLGKEKGDFAVFSSRPHDRDLCGDVLWLSS